MAVLRVLLLILKIIGITLLVILGVVLFLLLVILLAPVRYKGKFKKAEEPEPLLLADGTVTWLNPLVRFKIRFAEKKLTYKLRVLGICLMNSEKKKDKKEKPPKKAKNKKSKKTKNKKNEKKEEITEPAAVAETKPEMPEVVQSQSEAADGEIAPETTAAPEESDEPAEAPEEETKKKESVFTKIKNVIEKIKGIPAKIKEKVEGIKEQIKLLWEKKEAAVGFIKEERHVAAFGILLQAVKKLLKHILPTKFKGKVVYGSGDPASTGKAFAVLGVLYAAYGKGLTVMPDFEEKRLEADVFFKGRIRLGTVLVIALKAIFDKQVKRMYRNFKKLMKKLKQKAGETEAAE